MNDLHAFVEDLDRQIADTHKKLKLLREQRRHLRQALNPKVKEAPTRTVTGNQA
jgi:hypothetical protein